MAKSKSGGTRSYIRGRVGADVYSIGKDGLGKKQQVVRSLAETVANPQTEAQMRGRMIMSTVMQAVAAMSMIIDHSFDGMVKGQPSISEFIRRNYALIKADVAAHPASGNEFGLNEYQEKGVKKGSYVVSNGSAIIPAALELDSEQSNITIALTATTLTVGGLKAALGLTPDDYFTFCGIRGNGTFQYMRYRINPDLADTTAISSANVENVFVTEGVGDFSVALDTNSIVISNGNIYDCNTIIVSIKNDTGYAHNTAVLGAGDGFASAADVVLPTYPMGSENFLNGGDL